MPESKTRIIRPDFLGPQLKYRAELKTQSQALLKSCAYLAQIEIDNVSAAYRFAADAHKGQARRSGEPYILHPLAVAQKLADVGLDATSVIAALLHDVVEDTGVSLEQLEQSFGEEVATLVDGVTKLGNIKLSEQQQLAQASNFQKLALATARDIRVILIKLADRLHNMETIASLPIAKRKRIATETMDLYIPIANRLGIDDFRQSLEDYCLRAVYPMRYLMIAKAVEKANKRNANFLEVTRNEIDLSLQQSGIAYRLLARKKSIAGIYTKMAPRYSRWIGDKSHERRSFKEIMDIHAFRVLTNNVENCYRILGLLHQLFTPIHYRFKDYIAAPKSNGYQSLHTSLMSTFGYAIEVQIRTEDMEEVANKGVAAHQLYKEANKDLKNSSVSNLFHASQHWSYRAQDPESFIKHAKLDLYADEILVFSPKGDLLSLPKGATPIDFAYAIHTKIGNKCIACKIDGEPMPLNTKLENSQKVEIIVDEKAVPHPYWINFITTSKALAGINEALRRQRRIDAERLGTRLLEERLTTNGINIKDFAQSELLSLANKCGYSSWELLVEDVGDNVNRVERIVAEIADKLGFEYTAAAGDNSLVIDNENMIVRYASCCIPIPGDQIIAISSKDKGVTVHRVQCANLTHHNKRRDDLLRATWSPDIKGDFRAVVTIYQDISLHIITRIATAITHLESGIENLQTEAQNANLRVVNITVSVKDRIHLAKIIRRLRVIQGVQKIFRAGIAKPRDKAKERYF